MLHLPYVDCPMEALLNVRYSQPCKSSSRMLTGQSEFPHHHQEMKFPIMSHALQWQRTETQPCRNNADDGGDDDGDGDENDHEDDEDADTDEEESSATRNVTSSLSHGSGKTLKKNLAETMLMMVMMTKMTMSTTRMLTLMKKMPA